MGTWGTAIFSDDTAADVRDDFRERIGDGVGPEEATALMQRDWRDTIKDADEGPTFWLALAATQWSLGRLVPDVKGRALDVIDSGRDLRRWEDDPGQLRKRKAVLDRLRAQLVSPAPIPKKVPKRFRDSNDWPKGSVHAYRRPDGTLCLFRVIGHHGDDDGRSPVVEVLDWTGREVPDAETIGGLSVRHFVYPSGHRIAQFMIGATSNREFPAARLIDLNVKSEPSQQPENYTVMLWRFLDEHLDKWFQLDRNAT